MSHFIVRSIIFGQGNVEKWSSNLGQSQRHSMPLANKSANLSGERESFATNVWQNTTQFQACLIAALASGLPKQKGPQTAA